MAKAKRLDPIPPGEILLEEFMRPNGISQNRLARDLDVNPARVNDIVHGRSAITAPLALRLAKYFGTTPELWMNLQASYELRCYRLAEDRTPRANSGHQGGWKKR
jgi:antitoxin HigA-1